MIPLYAAIVSSTMGYITICITHLDWCFTLKRWLPRSHAFMLTGCPYQHQIFSVSSVYLIWNDLNNVYFLTQKSFKESSKKRSILSQELSWRNC